MNDWSIAAIIFAVAAMIVAWNAAIVARRAHKRAADAGREVEAALDRLSALGLTKKKGGP
jgi:hypothetical protein